jgi:succinate dehydrogenase/fumarate reductase flavoprotein subunit
MDHVESPDGGTTVAADVVVIGFGGSGAAAAIEAHDAGASVVIVEKQGRDQHWPSTALLAGGIMYTSDVSAAADYLIRCAGDLIGPAVSRAWAREAADVHTWLASLDPTRYRLGSSFSSAEYPHLPGAEAIVSAGGQAQVEGEWKKAGGPELFAALRAAVEARKIKVIFATRATRLAMESGRVVGVDAGSNGTTQRILAHKSVVLAAGGFGFDDEMKRQFLVGGADVHTYGSSAATGDGIRMAQAVGADLWHMSSISGRGMGHFRLSDGSVLNTIMLLDTEWLGGSDPVGYVITDGDGRRFADEYAQAKLSHSFYYQMLHFDPESGAFPRIPSYWFFDQRRIEAGPLTIPDYGTAKEARYVWSDDNAAEISSGWITQARTWEELGAKIGVPDPGVLAAEIDRYNEGCRIKEDTYRQRGPFTPLDRPPFYCVPLWPGGTNTTGGPRRNEAGQIMHVFGHAIPGLYGCGEAGQMMGARYPGQYAYYSEILCSGRIAGRGAAAEQSVRGQDS